MLPTVETLVCLFEPHANIIVKGGCDAETAKAQPDHPPERNDPGLVIETGNPLDHDRLPPMLHRHIAFYDREPRQTVALPVATT